MSDKSITSYQAGEYLQFQKSVVPEVTEKYSLGTRSNPFYTLFAQRVPLNYVQQFSVEPLSAGTTTVGLSYFTGNVLSTVQSSTVIAQATFSTF